MYRDQVSDYVKWYKAPLFFTSKSRKSLCQKMLLQNLLPVCLIGLATAITTDDGSTNLPSSESHTMDYVIFELIFPIACNKADVALVQFNSQTHPGLCNSWLNRFELPTFKFLNSANPTAVRDKRPLSRE